MTMLSVNGKRSQVDEGMTLAGLLAARGIDCAQVVVEVDGEVVKKESFETLLLRDGSAIEILRFVGGG
jgi:sulfur carrier protein